MRRWWGDRCKCFPARLSNSRLNQPQDLISYKIDQIKPLKLAMVSESTGIVFSHCCFYLKLLTIPGGLCGAIFLDAAFQAQVRTLISAEEFKDLSSRAKRKMMNEWEVGLKRTFKIDADENEKWHVDIPGYLGMPLESETGDSLPPIGFISNVSLVDLRHNSRYLSVLSAESIQRFDPGTLGFKT
jgi:hypothetical protein